VFSRHLSREQTEHLRYPASRTINSTLSSHRTRYFRGSDSR